VTRAAGCGHRLLRFLRGALFCIWFLGAEVVSSGGRPFTGKLPVSSQRIAIPPGNTMSEVRVESRFRATYGAVLAQDSAG